MTGPEQARALLNEFADARKIPLTDAALVQRMRTEATTWINAVHMQHRRVTEPVVDPSAPGNEVWRQEIDLHFLLVALTRLRRAIGLTAHVHELHGAVLQHLTAFDEMVPSLRTFRNVAEHFDDYTTGRGRVAEITRQQLQTWSLDGPTSRGLVWRWLDIEFPVDVSHDAATALYRTFLAAANNYLAEPSAER